MPLPNDSTNQLQELATLHNMLIAQNAYLASSASATAPIVTAKEPWVEEPIGSLPLDIQMSIPIPPMDGAYHTVVSYIVPTGWDAAFKAYNMNAQSNAFVEFQGDLVFQMTVDGRVIEGLSGIINSRGSIDQSRTIGGTVKVADGQTITISVLHKNNPAIAGYVAAGVKGYRYPRIG